MYGHVAEAFENRSKDVGAIGPRKMSVPIHVDNVHRPYNSVSACH